MTDNTTPPRSTNRWFSILGFQFSRRQAIRAAMLLAAGVCACCVAFSAWYYPPRATSRLIRSAGGNVDFLDEQVSNVLVAQFLHLPTRLFGLEPTDDEIHQVRLTESEVTDSWLHHLKALNRLRSLRIHGRQFGPGLAELKELSELSQISITQLRKQDLGQLQQFSNLQFVVLNFPDFPDIDLSKLASLRRLQTLSLSGIATTEQQLEQIAQCKSLEALTIDHCLGEPARKQIDHLARLPSLKFLHITDVTDETATQIAEIKSLTHLMINGANLTDEGVASLAKLPKLQYLQLRQCDPAIDAEALRKLMPRCQIHYFEFIPSSQPR